MEKAKNILNNIEIYYNNAQPIPNNFNNQFISYMMQAQSQMSHLNNIQREKADLMRSSMMSTASSCGIDISSMY